MRRVLLIALSGCDSKKDGPLADAGLPPPDAEPPCTEGATICAGPIHRVCVGGVFQDENCGTADKLCEPTMGCIDCLPDIGPVCANRLDLRECNVDGSFGPLIERCKLCSAGECKDPCEVAATRRSYVGCEYWPVDLQNNVDVFGGTPPCLESWPIADPLCYLVSNNAPIGLCAYPRDCSWSGRDATEVECLDVPTCGNNGQDSPFAIVVANPDPDISAQLTLEDAAGNTWTGTCGPGSMLRIKPQDLGFPDHSLYQSGISPKAYRLASDMPLVAYQFNPLDNAKQYTNDASLLLPAHSLDTKYWALSFPTVVRYPTMHNAEGFVAVVATAPGDTTITVTSTARTTPGLGVNAMVPGESQTLVLHQFDALNLKAYGDERFNGDDLSGTKLVGDQPFAAFGGHDGTNLGAYACCLDHLEEQLLPTSSWGFSYVVPRAQPRPNRQQDLVRVLAFRDNTFVSFGSGLDACPSPLNSGQFCEIFIDRDVELVTTEPVMVGHYLASSGGNQPGDPSLSLVAPVEQYRDNYYFLTPSEYAENYVSVTADLFGTVSLDGVDITSQLDLVPLSSNRFMAGRIPVSEGPHRIDCPAGCGLEVYGYDVDVSYMFAGGTDLKQITIP